MARIDVITQVADLDFKKLDALMREVAFFHCPQEPKRYKFCEETKRCIAREWINIFWARQVKLN